MLRTFGDLKQYTIGATDGDIGAVDDIYFDSQFWTVRYLVVDTGTWLRSRRVLISPLSVRRVDPDARTLRVELTRAQVEESPHDDTVKPVSRQHEIELARHYSYPYYWAGPYRWGLGYDPYVGVVTAPPAPSGIPSAVEEELLARERESADPNLHSGNHVSGYYIQALDDDVGHVEDFSVDDASWAIRYLIVDTRNWLPGKRVLVSPHWIKDVSWADSKVFVDMTRDSIERAPEYDPSRPLEREHEGRLFSHYGRPTYWEMESYRTGDVVVQAGAYSSGCCRYAALLSAGQSFPACGQCGASARWLPASPSAASAEAARLRTIA